MMLTYECFICGSFLSDILSPAFQLVVNVKEMEASQPQSGSLSGFPIVYRTTVVFQLPLLLIMDFPLLQLLQPQRYVNQLINLN